MSGTKDLLLREKGFGFFGAITASLSHEINNVLAIINELSGLLDDFFKAAEQGAALDPARLQRTTKSIATQVERGQTYVKRLNSFAHTVDEWRATVGVSEAVEAITTLCRRFGKLRKVELEASLPEASPAVEGSAFDLQHIVYRCIEIALHGSEEGDAVTIEVERSGEGARVVVAGSRGAAPSPELQAKQRFLELLAAELSGEVDAVLEEGQPVRLAVTLPRRLEVAAAG